MSEDQKDVYFDLFKELEGQYVGYYYSHGFEIIETKYSLEDIFVNNQYDTHKLTATKITGDTYVPAGKVTFYVEQTKSKEKIEYPIPGKGQIADFGYKNSRFIKGKLHSVLGDKSGFMFEWENLGSIMYVKRESKYQNSTELETEEEVLYARRMRDYAQTLSMDMESNIYDVGNSRSASLDLIEKSTKKIVIKEAQNCVICLSDMEKETEVLKLNVCDHEFHVKCIEKWLIGRQIRY